MASNPKKILVIDDEPDVVEFVTLVLRTKGHEIITAFSGEEGWQLLTEERPDLVIVDLRLPGMSGMEFCRRVRSEPQYSNTLLLVISSIVSGTNKPDSFWASGLGSDDFLSKPFDALGLLGRVEYLLRKGGYISDTGQVPQPGGKQPDSGRTLTPAPVNVSPHDADPDQAVRIFVESWNTRSFALEYEVLGDEMLGSVTRDEYIQRRQRTYMEENGDQTTHRVLDTHVTVSVNLAAVDCLREDFVGGIPKRKDEQYVLKKTYKGWKIVSMKSRPISISIE